MGVPMVDDPHANEWLELIMDWELAESSCSLKNEGSSTLTYEGGASDYECSNTGLGLYDYTSCKHTYNSAIILNHTANITINSNSLPLNGNLSKGKQEDTSLSSQEFCASPLDATSTTSKSHSPSTKAPNYHIDTESQVLKETSYASYCSSHNGVGGGYNTIIKGSDIKEGQILLHGSNMMGNFPLMSDGVQQQCVRSNAGNGVHLASVKSNYVLSRRTKANDSVLDQACEISKASDNVQLGQKLVIKRDANLLQQFSGMHQEPSPWPSSNHLTTCSEVDVSHAKTMTRPHRSKTMTASTSSSVPSAQPAEARRRQYSRSLTLSFNQQKKNPTSERPDDRDDEYHKNSSLGLIFSDSLIKESELDDMSGIIGNDDEDSFALITDAYKTRKKAKVAEDDSSARHCLAERKRREKLNKKFEELRAIVGPSLSVKTDKASIIGAAVKLLNDKKGLRLPVPEVYTTKIMREVNMSKEISNFHSHLISKGEKAIVVSDGSSSSFQVDSHPHKTKPHINLSEVFCDLEADFALDTMECCSCNSFLHDIKVKAKQQSQQRWHYIINVRAPRRPNIFSDIIITLSKLDLQVIFANSCFSNNNTLSGRTSPTMTRFLLKVEVVDEKLSSFDPHKCEIIHDAIKECIAETQQKKTRVEG